MYKPQHIVPFLKFNFIHSFIYFYAMPCSMWDLSSPTNRLNWYPLHWECRVLTTGPPGKSHQHTSKWVSLLLLCFHRHDKTKNPAEQCTGWIGFPKTVDLWNILYPWTCPHFHLWIFYPSRTQESKWNRDSSRNRTKTHFAWRPYVQADMGTIYK